MVVLKIIGWIVLAIVLLVLGVALLPVDLLLQSDGADGFRVRVRVLGLVFGGGKKKKKEKKPEGAFSKSLKRWLGISKPEDGEEQREAAKKRGFPGDLQETVELIFMLLDRLFWILKRCKIPYCRITAVSGGENAALDYGIACATLYPLAEYLQERADLNPKKLKMEIRCDYSRPQGAFELDLAVRVRVIHGLRAALHIIMKKIG